MSDGILLPCGGYRELLTYRKSLIVFDGTVCFCRRFMDSRDRTVDQMVQAARSGKQNIVEGSMAAVTSKETEIKLTGVARASLEELLEDYRDYLRVQDLPLWDKNSDPALAIRNLARTESESYDTYRPYLESRSDGTCANIMICLINQCTYLLRLQLEKLTAEFVRLGGMRERMTKARLNYRDKKL
ncbi:MAG: four helix bundle suffix domain-containing protein [Lentisphaeria bacterium]|nr:four helix bundle suffix domain-containing protein [Lentisphaeria bacterium]